MDPTIALILSTYNWPSALRLALRSLADQRYRRFEVVVADDGSGPDTEAVVRECARFTDVPVRHVWQEDRGFRLAAIRNRAVAATDADYLVFMDGDCVALPTFLGQHARLAERGYFVRGVRLLLSRPLTERALSQDLPIHRWRLRRWFRLWRQGEVSRFLPLLTLPLGVFRKSAPRSLTGLHGCNLGLWRDDFLALNGLNEAYEGWGYEDWDLVVRLMRVGITRKEGRFAVPVLHLWHESRRDFESNQSQFAQQQVSDAVRVERGVSQYLAGPATGG